MREILLNFGIWVLPAGTAVCVVALALGMLFCEFSTRIEQWCVRAAIAGIGGCVLGAVALVVQAVGWWQ